MTNGQSVSFTGTTKKRKNDKTYQLLDIVSMLSFFFFHTSKVRENSLYLDWGYLVEGV